MKQKAREILRHAGFKVGKRIKLMDGHRALEIEIFKTDDIKIVNNNTAVEILKNGYRIIIYYNSEIRIQLY